MSNKFEGIIENICSQPRVAGSYIVDIPDEEMPAFFGICSAKNLPLEVWNAIAIGLYDLKKIKRFLELMNFLINDQMEKPCYNDESNVSKKISIVNTSSIYYLNLAANENDIKQKNEYFAIVRINFNKSDKIKIEESSSFALKGYLLFYEGEYSKALDYFNQNSSCVVSILGTAILEFSSKNYEESLKLFKTALKLNPLMPANTRLGLAYNFFFLEKYQMAHFTFQRILKMDPNNIDALLGLAVLEFKNENFEKYYECLENAYKIDKASPFLLLHLAEFFLLRGDLEKARITSLKGYKVLKNCPKFVMDPNSQIQERKKRRNDFYEAKSRFLYIIGYYYHFKNKYDQALKYYEDAVQAFPLNLSAEYSLGQVCISQKNFAKALKCFEVVNDNSKDRNEECLKILGYLYLKNGKRLEAIEFYQKSLKFDPNDFETWIEYASLQEHYDIKISLEAYENALDVITQRKNKHKTEEIKPELLNNIGVLKMKLEKYDESLISFQNAHDICSKSEETRMENGHCKDLINTIQFNMGILYEEMKRLRDANERYKSIINQNPFYIDGYLRLSYLALKRGSSVKALEYCKQAIDKIEYSKKIRPDLALCLKGYIFQEIGDTTNARQAYESVKKKYGLEDPFADFSIMRMLYEESCELRDQVSDQKRYLKSLIEQSKIILNFDEYNYQAASIVAIVMAELGHFREAKEILNQIEYNQQNINMLVNVAHLEYLKGNYENSIKIYTSYLQKNPVPDEYIEMCIVINFYLLKRNDEALKMMKKLVLRNPESLIHRYNLCVLLHNSAQTVLEQKDRKKEQTEKSIEYLKKIQPIYEYLFKNHYARKTRDDLEKCDDSRRKSKRIMEKMREASENKLNYIQSHQSRFENFLREDEEMIKKKLISVEEKKRKIQEMKEKELKEKLEREKKEDQKRQEYEFLAMEQMKNAQKIAESLRERHESQQLKKKMAERKKSNKPMKKTKKMSDEDERNNSSDNGYNPSEEEEEKNPFIFDNDKENEDEILRKYEEKEEVEENEEDQLELMAEKMNEELKKKQKMLKRKFKGNEDEDNEGSEKKNEENLEVAGRKKRKLVKHFFDEKEDFEGIFQEKESPSRKEEISAYDPLKMALKKKEDDEEEENIL